MEVAMLETKTRIPPVDVEALPDDLRETLEEQRRLYGAALSVPLLCTQRSVLPRGAGDVDRAPAGDKAGARCAPRAAQPSCRLAGCAAWRRRSRYCGSPRPARTRFRNLTVLPRPIQQPVP